MNTRVLPWRDLNALVPPFKCLQCTLLERACACCVAFTRRVVLKELRKLKSLKKRCCKCDCEKLLRNFSIKLTFLLLKSYSIVIFTLKCKKTLIYLTIFEVNYNKSRNFVELLRYNVNVDLERFAKVLNKHLFILISQ